MTSIKSTCVATSYNFKEQRADKTTYLYLKAGAYVQTGINYSDGDECKAITIIRYESGGTGRDLMGYSAQGGGYWGVKAGGTWEPHGTFSYTDSDITKINTITYTFSSSTEHGIYNIGRLGTSYSVRNKYIYHVMLYKNGTLVSDLYPKTLNSAIGLIDLVTNTFYPATASGTNSIAIGDDELFDKKTSIEKAAMRDGEIDEQIVGYQLIEI